ncbi:MAG TPA: Rne/Rng family ribonuclease, partial [Candidatus Eremiobacteraceae bacterium]|nr:Rne/Rng family ribonuclease [Candidatus Eremiobacteraceae bacterium]
MKTEILISCDEWENRVAVLEEGSLAEIYFEREEKVIGSIYKARVENVLPGMGACFVNIGLGRNAFLYVDDIMRDPINIGETEITDRRKGHTVNELLKVGSDVLVQIVKEPRGLKGARVSTNISLPGRYLVLMPTGRYSGVSSKIEDANERARLKQILRRVRPEGMATIVRTAAQGVSEAELIADLGVQLRLWHGILESYKRASAPALLHKDLNLAFKAVRDFLTSDVSAVYIDSKEQYEEIRSTMSLLGPQYIDRLKLVDGPGTLFATRGIDEELQKLLKPKIPLPSGGHLVLEHTEALTVIDVNTGKFTGGRNLEDTIVRTNLEAAAEIARQVRLRDIGGIIVVDFIDMARERSREQVIQTLTASLRRDRTRSTIQAFSNLGLLEFTRKRVGKDLAGQLRSECPYCSGLGTVMSSETLAIGVLRQIRGIAANGHRVKKLDVVCDASVATQLVGWYREELEKLAHDHDIEVGLFVEPLRHREHVIVEEARRLRPAPQPGMVVEAELLPVRMPNPASGVAVINGYVAEVKDAANGAGQTVKIKVDAVGNNLIQAELAEALQLGQRRRRRERGRVKGLESEAPIAPPVPTLAAAERQAERGAERERPRPAARVRVQEAEPEFFEDEEEPVRAPAASRRPARAAAASRSRDRDLEERRETRPSRRRGSRPGSQQYPPPLVVGGEGEIDYEDDEDEAVSTTPPRARAKAPDEESSVASAHRRRRRRGRGGKERPADARTSSVGAGDEDDDIDREDEAVVTPQRRPTAPVVRRPAASTGRYGRDSRPPDDEDELDTVVDPRRPETTGRSPKRYGQVRQIYGRPLQADEGQRAPRGGGRPPSRETDGDYRPSRPAAPPRKSYADDDLDVVISPRAPAAIHVDARPDLARRASSHERRPATAEPETRPRRGEREERPRRYPEERPPVQRRAPEEREEHEHRERPQRGRGERGPRRSGSGREPMRRPRSEGPAVKQVYPPPDQEEEPADGPRGTNAPLRNAKSPRGPLMRPADAPPVPKGKVRQLYPPPPFDATVDSDPDRRERDTANLEAFDDDAEPAFEAPSS